MKKVFFIFLCLCTAFVFFSCHNTNVPDRSEETTAKPADTNNQDDTLTGIEGVRIWDSRHPDDSERYPEWAITFEFLPEIEFKRDTNGAVSANDELLIGGGCTSFYTAKLTETDKPVLCFGMCFGSGICDERIVIIDFETKQEIFALNDRENFDYQLFVRDGLLRVRELKYLNKEVTRTGLFTYDGTDVQILWDTSANIQEDRDFVSDGQPIS